MAAIKLDFKSNPYKSNSNAKIEIYNIKYENIYTNTI